MLCTKYCQQAKLGDHDPLHTAIKIAEECREKWLAEAAENERLRTALKPLLDHYLECYDGNRDALAIEAGALLGNEQRASDG